MGGGRDAEPGSDSEPIQRKVCLGCGKLAPPTNDQSLIGVRHGWRLTIGRDDAGRKTPEWRCSSCFGLLKLLQREPETGSDSDPDSDSEPIQREVCIGCRQLAPPTTDHSLISARHGWRLTLGRDAAGRKTP